MFLWDGNNTRAVTVHTDRAPVMSFKYTPVQNLHVVHLYKCKQVSDWIFFYVNGHEGLQTGAESL